MTRRRQLWYYPLFQIPLILLIGCVLLALLFSLLNWGRPSVAVVLSLDLSGSTFGNSPLQFNQPQTVMAQQVLAAKLYIQRNQRHLATPNEVMIHGFGRNVVFLTPRFETHSDLLLTQLDQALNRSDLLAQVDPTAKNLSGAIAIATQQLQQIPNRCREVLLITDGAAPVDAGVVANARQQRVKINAIVVGDHAPQLAAATEATGGQYRSAPVALLEELVGQTFFESFNRNTRWPIFWGGMAIVCFMWLLVLPLDRWVLQGWLHLPMNRAGQIALLNALFWTVAIPMILWRFPGWPFVQTC
ncbi:MAG TPA: VWA domain-containing protein [Thermosynechococcus sp. M3746_W2019_013]|uniref:vWA domain-containing protein n=1 Tax=Thermosynechococcus sp. M3746_W2019_013 TaxID=2747806 RepID=UPI0019F3A688|nr:vWA domain-containing protein [Thermosynechococcus sp. M3746_W2019_013]HIK23156.1 VWA domain-containing protein [Thermosynechococcus sp. M3746_W2019_013]